MIEVQGLVDFSPEDFTRKHKNQSVWKRTAIIKTGCDLDSYYAWFLKKRFNLELNKNLRGSHVTIISDRMNRSVFDEGSKLFMGKPIKFYYNPFDIRTNGKHWWLNVTSSDAENIRESLGLSRIPYFGLHLTIGHANEKNIQHSEYILRQLKKFDI